MARQKAESGPTVCTSEAKISATVEATKAALTLQGIFLFELNQPNIQAIEQ
jgi:hypothetical protein